MIREESYATRRHIESVWRYPVKSMHSEELNQAYVGCKLANVCFLGSFRLACCA